MRQGGPHARAEREGGLLRSYAGRLFPADVGLGGPTKEGMALSGHVSALGRFEVVAEGLLAARAGHTLDRRGETLSWGRIFGP